MRQGAVFLAVVATIATVIQGAPFGGSFDCCLPSPTCANPCPMPQLPPMPPPPPPMEPQGCCMPAPSCQNPCQPGQAPGMGGPPVVYAPYPGEITFKLLQHWDPDGLLDPTSPSFQILEGNVRHAIQAVLGPYTQVTNVYFREGYVPGNPSTKPKVVVHCMVNGGSDAASLLEANVTPDGVLGDGLKVYKDSFNAY